MDKYEVYIVTKNRMAVAKHFYRVNMKTGLVEDWRSYRLEDGKPVYKWQRSRLTYLCLVKRCDVRYWINNGCGAKLVAKNVEFKP